MKIKIPPMPDPDAWFNGAQTGDYTEAQLAARDQQWLELVGPVVVALSVILNNNESLVFEAEARSALRAITEGQQ